MNAPFDRVVVLEPGVAPRTYLRDDFVSLPIHVRVRYILERRVEFFSGTTLVDRAEALKALRALSAARSK